MKMLCQHPLLSILFILFSLDVRRVFFSLVFLSFIHSNSFLILSSSEIRLRIHIHIQNLNVKVNVLMQMQAIRISLLTILQFRHQRISLSLQCKNKLTSAQSYIICNTKCNFEFHYHRNGLLVLILNDIIGYITLLFSFYSI